MKCCQVGQASFSFVNPCCLYSQSASCPSYVSTWFQGWFAAFKRICFIVFPGYPNILCCTWKWGPFAFFPFLRASHNHKGLSEIINNHLAVTLTSSFTVFVCQQPVWLAWKVALTRDLGSLTFCWCQFFAEQTQISKLSIFACVPVL